MALDAQGGHPRDRRTIFRLGFKHLVEPVAEYLADRLNVQLPIVRAVLRPPGAVEERAFLATCYRCGNCVDVCPARAIRVLSTEDVQQAGTPYIDPDLAACVVCDDLACIKACPSGALKAVDRRSSIHMGLARVNALVCVRRQGEACTLCVDKCPLGRQAIDLGQSGQVAVDTSGCVGCGVCQFYCPSQPKAVVVDPE